MTELNSLLLAKQCARVNVEHVELVVVYNEDISFINNYLIRLGKPWKILY